jgi:integrase
VDFVFTTTGERAVSGISMAKERLDKRMLELLRAALINAGQDAGQIGVGESTLHDLRRRAATGMIKLNIAPHVVDRILNHVSGTIRGVAAVYNRHAYIEEWKSALDAWARYLEGSFFRVWRNIVQLAAEGSWGPHVIGERRSRGAA